MSSLHSGYTQIKKKKNMISWPWIQTWKFHGSLTCDPRMYEAAWVWSAGSPRAELWVWGRRHNGESTEVYEWAEESQAWLCRGSSLQRATQAAVRTVQGAGLWTEGTSHLLINYQYWPISQPYMKCFIKCVFHISSLL